MLEVMDTIKKKFLARFSDKINLFLLATTIMSVLFSINLVEKSRHWFSFSYQMAETILASLLFCILILFPKITGDDKTLKLKAPVVALFALFASYKIFYLYMSNITKIPFLWGFAFILLFALIFLLAFWFFKIVFKDDYKAIIVSLVIIFALNLHFVDLGMIRSYLGCIFYAGICALIFLNAQKMVSFLKPFCGALIVFCVLNGFYNLFSGGCFANFIKKPVQNEELKYTKKPNRDIYIILLDAYAGSRTLKHLGIDNSDFINKLKQKGFVIHENMESNYSVTIGSIPSFLNADYVQNLPYNTPSDAVNNAKMLRMAKQSGYKIYYINSWPLDLHIKKGVINSFKSSDENVIEDIVELFFDRTILSRLVFFDKDAKIRRAKRMQELFKYFDDVILDNGGKRFVFAHFLMPHDPYIFDENGDVIMGISANQWISKNIVVLHEELYKTYLKFADNKTLEFVDKIFAQKREKPIIIIMGDHGPRTFAFKPFEEKDAKLARENYKFLFNTFIAYYNPDYEPKYYENTKSHVNFAINFLNENFGTELQNVKDEHYFVKKTIETFDKIDVYNAKY